MGNGSFREVSRNIQWWSWCDVTWKTVPDNHWKPTITNSWTVRMTTTGLTTLVRSTKLLYAPVSTGMDDRIGVQLPVREIYLSPTNHPGQLSLAIPRWVGTMSTGQMDDFLRLGSKGRYGSCLVAGKTCVNHCITRVIALEAKLLRLSAVQIHSYFTLFYIVILVVACQANIRSIWRRQVSDGDFSDADEQST